MRYHDGDVPVLITALPALLYSFLFRRFCVTKTDWEPVLVKNAYD